MSNQLVNSALASSAREYGLQTLSLLAKSKLGLSGLALALAGFFGIFGVVGLQLQQAIISVYVCMFGLTLIVFSLGTQSEVLGRYFGFIYRPHGQLAFLLVAGNLAWSTGLFGFLAAAFTNFVAVSAFYSETNGAGLPFLSRGGSGDANAARASANATGMVDRDDELL